jgi:hypothetical protein
LAAACWRAGNVDEARQWYRRAVEYMDKNAPHDQMFKIYCAEAEKVMKG